MERCQFCNRPRIIATSATTGCCPKERALQGFGDSAFALKLKVDKLEARIAALEEKERLRNQPVKVGKGVKSDA